MEIIRERLDAPVDRKTGQALWEALARVYRPAIHHARGDLREKLGLERAGQDDCPGGELFLNEMGQVLFYRLDGKNPGVEAGTLLKEKSGTEIFEGFKEAIAKAVTRGEGKSRLWAPVPPEEDRFGLLRQEIPVLRWDPAEMEAAARMEPGEARSLLVKIRDRKSCFQEDLLSGPQDYSAIETINSLESFGLVGREFCVFCKKTGQQISRVDSLAAIEEARSHGFKCFACGNLLSEERISPRIFLTPLGERMARPNYWLALAGVKMLQEVNPGLGDVLYFSEKDNSVFDIFCSCHSRFMMIEVRDEPAGLKDLFMFLARVRYYRPFMALLVSAHPVPQSGRMYLSSFDGPPLVLVEGQDRLRERLLESFSYMVKDYVKSFFAGFRQETAVPVTGYLMEKFHAGRYPVPAGEERGITPPGGMPAPPVQAPADEGFMDRLEGMAEVIPGQELDVSQDDGEISPESLETTELISQLTTEMEIPDDVSLMDEYMEELDMELPAQETEAAEIMVDDMNAPGGDILEELSEQAVDFLDSELSMELSEALPQEILPVEEIPPAVESQEEKLDRAASSILALAAEKGIHGNVNFIERELALIGDIESFRALLIDSNGLSVAGSLPQDMDRDALAAYSSAVCQMAQEVLDEHGVSKAGLIHIEGESGRVKVFQAGGHYLMAHQEGKADADDDFEASPGDAPVKKGMEELPRGEWAFGSLIASRDGKLLKAALTQGLDGPTLAHMSARLLAQCWRYAGRLPVGRVLRIYVRNEEVIFCLVPLENRAVLTVLADPSIPWDTWQGSLHHAAQALAGAFA